MHILLKKQAEYADKDTIIETTGWAKFVRFQGKMIFIEMTDGTAEIQVFVGKHLSIDIGKELPVQSAIRVRGNIVTDSRSKSGYELKAHEFEIIGTSEDEFSSRFNQESKTNILLDQRHLVYRGDLHSRKIIQLRAELKRSLRNFYHQRGFTEIDPPTIVTSQCEGGATLFKLDIDDKYFGKPAYMTQSSQFYLETMIPTFRNVYCMTNSYRAEKSSTARHLCEFMHVEGEMAFINFEDLLYHIEDLLVTVTGDLFERCGDLIASLNPDWHPYTTFKRIRYSQAIKLLQDDIKKENGFEPFELKYGDDLSDSLEKRLLEIVKEPIFLTHFPAEMKSFYMKRDTDVPTETESVDVLLPGLGEVFGASTRISDYDELLTKIKAEGLDPKLYYWYLDLRKYGTCEHGGYGLGLERLLMLIAGQKRVQFCCTYPRCYGRAEP